MADGAVPPGCPPMLETTEANSSSFSLDSCESKDWKLLPPVDCVGRSKFPPPAVSSAALEGSFWTLLLLSVVDSIGRCSP